jgi:hypothetical protein
MEKKTRRNKKKMLKELMENTPKCYICKKYYHSGFQAREPKCRICDECYCDNYDIYHDMDEIYVVMDFDWRESLYWFYTYHNLKIDCSVLYK